LSRQGLDLIKLADCCVPVSEVSGRQHLRSASRRKLNIPQLVLSQQILHTLQAFSVAGQIDSLELTAWFVAWSVHRVWTFAVGH